MRTLKNFVLVMVAVTGVIFTSCQSNSSEVASTSTNPLGVQLSAVNSTYSFADGTRALTTGTLTWDTCKMYVSRVHLSAKQIQGDSLNYTIEADLKFKGSKLIDLFNANSLLGGITLQPGLYNRISILIQSNKRDAGKSPVFYLSGKYTNASNTVTSIALIVNEDLSFNVSEKDSVQINSLAAYTDLLQLDLTTLMSNNVTSTELDNATRTNGEIIISSTSNANLYRKILMRIYFFRHAGFFKQRRD